MAAVGERFLKSHRLSGVPALADTLHMPVCPAGKADQVLHRPMEELLLTAGAEVCETGFAATLDSAMRFSARAGQFPFVLCTDSATTAAVLQLRKAIAVAQQSLGLPVTGVSSFLPHVTLLQGHSVDAVEESISPISWRVDEFVLLRSFFGQSRHEIVGRWPLALPVVVEPVDMLEEMASMPPLPDFFEDE